MATTPSSTVMEQEAKCPICLEYLRDPVTLDCGHNYCRACITSYYETWEELGEDLECPVCKAPIQKGNFRPNWQLASIVENIKLLLLEKESLCVTHQEKLLLFCKEDEELVCWLCKRSPEHKVHTVLLKEEAAQQYKDLFHHRLKILRKERERILALKAGTEKENQALLKQRQAEREKTVAQFRELHQFLEDSERRLLAQMEEMEKEIARKRDEQLRILSEELSSLESIIREMEDKCQQSVNELLQDVRSVMQRSEKEKFEHSELKWRIWDFCDMTPIPGEVLKQFKDALLPDLQLQEAANVTLDPDTAHPKLVLSEDHKSVRMGEKSQDLPDNPKRFNYFPFVLGREGFTAGRHFWEVMVGKEEEWALGITRTSIRRKGHFDWSPEQGIWVVEYGNGAYWASVPPHYPRLSVSGQLKRIRVCLNCEEGRVAFYDAERRTLLYTSGVSSAGQTLLPLFCVFREGHLRISP